MLSQFNQVAHGDFVSLTAETLFGYFKLTGFMKRLSSCQRAKLRCKGVAVGFRKRRTSVATEFMAIAMGNLALHGRRSYAVKGVPGLSSFVYVEDHVAQRW